MNTAQNLLSCFLHWVILKPNKKNNLKDHAMHCSLTTDILRCLGLYLKNTQEKQILERDWPKVETLRVILLISLSCGYLKILMIKT